MRAILIDPVARKISEIDISKENGIKAIYAAIGVDCFCCINLTEHETLYLDDEGLYRDDQQFFYWNGYPQPLAGKGLILHTDEMGESRATEMKIEDIVRYVSWMSDTQSDGFDVTEGEQDHPMLGKVFVVSQKAKFAGGQTMTPATMADVIA